MPVTGLRLSLCTAGVLQLLSATGSIFLASALQLTSEGKTFWRVAEELSWSKALGYCRRHHTDLADLHSMSGWSSIKALYSLTSSHEAWVGLFFDVRLGGLRWSSGSSFSASLWGSLPTFREGLCATLYSITFLPSLGAAWCTARRPFICYYDPTVGAHTLLEPVLSLTATPKPVEVQLGNLIFKRFDQEKMWLEALGYCRRYHTDLADLQTVTEEMDEDLKSITSNTEAWIGLYFSAASGSPRWSSDRGSSIPSWLQPPKFGAGLCAGLSRYWSFPSRISAVTCFSLKPFICFDVSGGTSHQSSMSGVADLGLLCAPPRQPCSHTPCWCFLTDPTIGHRDLAALPQLFHTPSSEVTVGMTPRPSTSFGPADAMKRRASAGPFPQQVSLEPAELSSSTLGSGTSTSAGPAAPQPRGTASPSPLAHVPVPVDGGPWTSPVTTQNMSFGPAPPASSPTPAPSPTELVHWRSPSVPQGVTESPLASASSPAPGPAPPEDSGTQGGPGRPREDAAGPSLSSTRGASAHPGVTVTSGAATSSGSRGAEPPGTKESTVEPSSSGSSAVLQRTNMTRKGPAQSQAAGPETAGSRPWPDTGARPPGGWGPRPGAWLLLWGDQALVSMPQPPVRERHFMRDDDVATGYMSLWAVTSERSGTNMTDTAPATQAQHWSSANHPESKEKTPAPKPGQLFGILKADFLISVLMDPEDMKDQFLSEIQDVLNLTLGHEQFRLKWVGFEVNKK
ncbi:putative C-type lectin domain family 20 member A [Cervus elaphus]|uniref:putative C-type lectin domain family 20 member A n=1 Tax=Cervus elaphus TaxID=9860 RepID=UPI001CC2E223|nr:putative C-type lectin domain family 20 member A [Cervus elaphus]